MKLKSRLCAIVRRTFLVTFIGSQSLIVAQAQVQGSTDDLAKLNSTDVVAGKGYAAKEGDQLTVLYLGKFRSGQVFDSNMDSQYKPDLEKLPFTFTLGAKQVIAGWDGGMVGAKLGTVRQLEIPWAMAYGAEGKNPIPAKSDLFFTVKVLCVTRQGAELAVDFDSIKVGSGRKVKLSSTVTINYTGTALNGKVFEKQNKLTSRVSKFVGGFKQSLVGMRKGGIRKVHWPIGAPNPSGQIPSGQPVEFLVEMLSVK